MTYYIGTTSGNTLVSNQFNPDSFQLVQEVYRSLELLRTIYKYLPELGAVGSNINRIELLEPYMEDITSIGFNLHRLLDLESNTEFLKEMQPSLSTNKRLSYCSRATKNF